MMLAEEAVRRFDLCSVHAAGATWGNAVAPELVVDSVRTTISVDELDVGFVVLHRTA